MSFYSSNMPAGHADCELRTPTYQIYGGVESETIENER